MQDSTFDRDLVRATMVGPPKVTQATLARHLGIHQSGVAGILDGSRQVKVHEAEAIYAFLHIEREPTIQRVPIIGLGSAGSWNEAAAVQLGEMVLPIRVAGPRTFAIEIKGDSMDKLLPDGGFVAVDPEQRQLYDRKVYLVKNADEETTIKLYRSDPARLEPVSGNDEHKPILLGDFYVEIIGRVVWRGSPV